MGMLSSLLYTAVYLLAVLCTLVQGQQGEGHNTLRDQGQPNIVFVLADDFGYNDIGYRSKQIRTPALDALARSGVILDNYYVQPICTPTRSQLLSGRYQIHTGLQHEVIRPEQPNALPLEFPTIADQLKKGGYSTHMVGKWHLGFYKKEFVPFNRGFDTFFGYLIGAEHYFTHNRAFSMGGMAPKPRKQYLDLRTEKGPVRNETGHYSANLFSEKAINIIKSHDKKKPLFLYLAYQSVHVPLEVPQRYLTQYKSIKDQKRRKYAAMVSVMDEGVNNVTQALKDADLWDNTIFVFSTDNGGHPVGGGNNFPLRGFKGTLWEGGMRGVGFLAGGRVTQRSEVNKEFIHVSDWYPTLMRVAGVKVNSSDLKLDGFDQWDTISQQSPSPRKELLHNIDPLHPLMGPAVTEGLADTKWDPRIRAAIRSGRYKLITGDPGPSVWVPPPGESHANTEDDRLSNSADEDAKEIPGSQSKSLKQERESYKTDADVFTNERQQGIDVGAPKSLGLPKNNKVIHDLLNSSGNSHLFREIANAGVNNTESNQTEKVIDLWHHVWLFDIEADPTEKNDLSNEKPEIVKQLMSRLVEYSASAVPPRYPPFDPKSDPGLHGGVWGPWE